jgi:hypothetical protein
MAIWRVLNYSLLSAINLTTKIIFSFFRWTNLSGCLLPYSTITQNRRSLRSIVSNYQTVDKIQEISTLRSSVQ